MTRTPADLLDKTYNRQVFSNPVSLPATNLPYLDGVRFVYNLGRLKSYNDDRAELLVDLNEEAKAEGKAFEDYCSAWQEQWGGADTDADFITDATDELVARTVALENYKVAWRTRVRLRIAAFLIERYRWLCRKGGCVPDPIPFLDRQIYGYWWKVLRGEAAEWPANPMFRFYLQRRILDPQWPARVWATLYSGQALPNWLMSYDSHVENLCRKCAQKIALTRKALSA
jgi:hypothetical protein